MNAQPAVATNNKGTQREGREESGSLIVISLSVHTAACELRSESQWKQSKTLVLFTLLILRWQRFSDVEARDLSPLLSLEFYHYPKNKQTAESSFLCDYIHGKCNSIVPVFDICVHVCLFVPCSTLARPFPR